jgi:PTS system nitrogen regulatory IIA component
MEEFDVPALAAYLHLAADKVQKLADRGKLPGRKVSGEWRFSRPEVHQWLERQLDTLNDEELQRIEGAMHKAASDTDAGPPTLHEILQIESIAVPLLARTRNSVMRNMVELATVTGQLWDDDKMLDAVRQREELHSTALDIGVALLHPRRPMAAILGGPILAFGRTWQGIPFGGQRGSLTDLFFLICSTNDADHLATLARLSRLLGEREFLEQLRAAEDPKTAREVITEAERDRFD